MIEGGSMRRFQTQHLLELLKIIYLDISEQKERLTQLDAAAGDGDLGVNMELGFRTIWEGVKDKKELTLSSVFAECGFLFNRAAPSTLGTVISSVFFAFAGVCEGTDSINRKKFADMMDAAMTAVQELGGARPGDKTILDSMQPFTETLREHLSGPDLSVWKIIAQKTEEAAERTADMVPKIGRARMYGEKSRGIQDGGAVVFAVIVRSMEKYFTV